MTLLGARTAAAQDVTSQINTEIKRYRQSLTEKPVSDSELSGVVSTAEDSLRAASAAAKSGHVYLSLEQLGMGVDLLRGAQAAADKDDVVKVAFPRLR